MVPLGVLAWLSFLGLFVYSGVRMLMKASGADRMWYFIAVSSFVSATYIWFMSVIYVPGAVVLLLGALEQALQATGGLGARCAVEGAHTEAAGLHQLLGDRVTLPGCGAPPVRCWLFSSSSALP